MFWKTKKKGLHKKIVLAIALPYNREQFFSLLEKGNSDFLHSLAEKYGKTGEELWECYQPVAHKISELIEDIRKQGVEIVDKLTLDSLHPEADSHAVIILAHRSEREGGPELFDGVVRDEDLVLAFPENFSGWLDVSSCSSQRILSLARMHFSNPDAHIIAPDRKTALEFRLKLYQEIIKELVQNPELDYFEGLKKVLQTLRKESVEKDDPSYNDPVFLGAKTAASTIYAPADVVKGQQFMVQVFVHVDASSGEINIMATGADADAEKKRTVPLSVKGKDIKLRKGDEITVALKPSGAADDFEFISPKRKTIFYSGSDTSAEFIIKVKDTAESDSFFGNVKISVNRIPAAEATFKVKIVAKRNEEVRPLQLSLSPFNIESEMESARNDMLNNLNSKRKELLVRYEEAADAAERKKIEDDLKVCTGSIALLKTRFNEITNVKKVVFISSTSDLAAFRKVLEEQVKACDMVPEMYEYWPQGNTTPSDACCAKVLSSDILVCVLGAKYGYVKPDSGMSMTEMELKCALQAGKPVLVYVLKDYKDRMKGLLPDEKEAVEKQNRLIERIETERLIKYITDETSLSTISGRELERLKSSFWPS